MSKELKALERVKNFMSKNAVHWKQDIAMIETALKALEIIKNKRVDIGLLLDGGDVNHYNYRIDEKWKQTPRRLTQEEYDFLKEVLL